MKLHYTSITIEQDPQTGLYYHIDLLNNRKPLYPQRYKSARHFFRFEKTIVEDDKGHLIIDMYGKSLVGEDRFAAINFVGETRIIHMDDGQLIQEPDACVFAASPLVDTEFIIFVHEDKYYLVEATGIHNLTPPFIYYQDYNVLFVHYSIPKNSEYYNYNKYGLIIIDINTGKELWRDNGDNDVAVVNASIDREVPHLIRFEEQCKTIGTYMHWYASILDGFKTMYPTKEDAINHFIRFDEVLGKELITL